MTSTAENNRNFDGETSYASFCDDMEKWDKSSARFERASVGIVFVEYKRTGSKSSRNYLLPIGSLATAPK